MQLHARERDNRASTRDGIKGAVCDAWSRTSAMQSSETSHAEKDFKSKLSRVTSCDPPGQALLSLSSDQQKSVKRALTIYLGRRRRARICAKLPLQLETFGLRLWTSLTPHSSLSAPPRYLFVAARSSACACLLAYNPSCVSRPILGPRTFSTPSDLACLAASQISVQYPVWTRRQV